MNILFISSMFPNPPEPNRGIFSLQIVKELGKIANVKVIAPVASTGVFKLLNSFKKYKTDLKIPPYRSIGKIDIYHPPYNAIPGMGFLHHLSIYKRLKPLITNLDKEWKIDAVNCHWIFPDGVAVQKICREMGLPLMLTALGTDLNYYITLKLRKEIIKKALKGADKVSVLSKSMYDKCMEMAVSSQRLVIIPNGVDLGKFDIVEREVARRKIGINEKGEIILFVGSLVPVKGVDYLLKAFALLLGKKENSNVRLYLVGSGFLQEKLRRLGEQLGISKKIEFVGPIIHSELVLWMNAANCLCLPSVNEGHPNVMMEALACGTPVVASAVGSIPDFVNSDNGATVIPGDSKELSETLDICLNTNYTREKIRGALQHYSWKNCAEQYSSEIKKIA